MWEIGAQGSGVRGMGHGAGTTLHGCKALYSKERRTVRGLVGIEGWARQLNLLYAIESNMGEIKPGGGAENLELVFRFFPPSIYASSLSGFWPDDAV